MKFAPWVLYFSMSLNPIGSINGLQPLVEGQSSVFSADPRKSCTPSPRFSFSSPSSVAARQSIQAVLTHRPAISGACVCSGSPPLPFPSLTDAAPDPLPLPPHCTQACVDRPIDIGMSLFVKLLIT
jgi:hypothetical protein